MRMSAPPGVRAIPLVRSKGFNKAGAVFSQESLRGPTTRPSVSQLAPTPRDQGFAPIRSDLASAIGKKADPLKVAPWPRMQPEDMTGSNVDHLDIARGSRSGRCAVPDERKEDSGAQSGAHAVVRRGRTYHDSKASSRIAWIGFIVRIVYLIHTCTSLLAWPHHFFFDLALP